jgi:hypothetical protein
VQSKSWRALSPDACRRAGCGGDPVLPKSKGCAILIELLYRIEIIDIFIFQKISTGPG